MKKTTIYCDICGQPVENHKTMGYSGCSFTLRATGEMNSSMDICEYCEELAIVRWADEINKGKK